MHVTLGSIAPENGGGWGPSGHFFVYDDCVWHAYNTQGNVKHSVDEAPGACVILAGLASTRALFRQVELPSTAWVWDLVSASFYELTLPPGTGSHLGVNLAPDLCPLPGLPKSLSFTSQGFAVFHSASSTAYAWQQVVDSRLQCEFIAWAPDGMRVAACVKRSGSCSCLCVFGVDVSPALAPVLSLLWSQDLGPGWELLSRPCFDYTSKFLVISGHNTAGTAGSWGGLVVMSMLDRLSMASPAASAVARTRRM